VGLTLANLLGTHGVKTLVIERNAALEPEPRAVTLDDESLRTFQNAGLVDEVVKDVVLGYGVQYHDWKGRPFAAIQPTREEYGYPKRNEFRQPVLVRTLSRVCSALRMSRSASPTSSFPSIRMPRACAR
jgi:3-(3-hydroxy-phenyl)propionate hydroxylase